MQPTVSLRRTRLPMLRLCTLALLALSPSQAFALDCRTATDQTSLDQCAEREFRTADDELNAVFKQVEGRLGNAAVPDARTLLIAAQRAWVVFRDAECTFKASDSQGGSMHGLLSLHAALI